MRLQVERPADIRVSNLPCRIYLSPEAGQRPRNLGDFLPDCLDCDLLPEFQVNHPVDLSHATLTEVGENLESVTEDVPFEEKVLIGRCAQHGYVWEGRRLKEIVGVAIRDEQLVNLSSQLDISTTMARNKSIPLALLLQQSSFEDAFDFFPTSRKHGKPLESN